MSKVSFDVTCPTVSGNGLQLELVRFWNTRLPKRLNKDTMFLRICKAK